MNDINWDFREIRGGLYLMDSDNKKKVSQIKSNRD